MAPIRRDGSRQPAARRTLVHRPLCWVGLPCLGLEPPPLANPRLCLPSPRPVERPGRSSMRRKAGWPSQQPTGIEPEKSRAPALVRLASPQAGSAPVGGSRLAGPVPVSAAEVAAPRPERACLRARVGLALPFAKAIAPRRRMVQAPRAQWGAGQPRIEGAGAAWSPSLARRPVFRLEAESALGAPQREAESGPAIRVSPRSQR
jgi:hypothetical protein